MEPYQERVVKEKEELDKKLAALDAFIKTEKFESLPKEDRHALNWQAAAMNEYSNILNYRIKRFDE